MQGDGEAKAEKEQARADLNKERKLEKKGEENNAGGRQLWPGKHLIPLPSHIVIPVAKGHHT
jgi:hypothetical protein